MAFGIEMDADGVPTLFHSSRTAAIHQWPLVTTRHDWSRVKKGTPVVVTHMRTRKNQPPAFCGRPDGLTDALFVRMVNRLEGGREVMRPLLRSTLRCGKEQAAEACYFAFADDARSVAGLVRFMAEQRAERQMAHLFCTYADGRKKELAAIEKRSGSECEHPAARCHGRDRGKATERGADVENVLIEELNELLHGDPYTVHPAAELFPLVEGEDFESLVNSIREHGVQTPVMFGWDENEKPVLLDGRNRLRAVERLKEQGITVQVPVRSFDYTRDGITEVEWIESQNFDRRHLTDDQRVTIAAALWPMIEAEAREAQRASQFDAEKARAAAAKRHDKTATADSSSPQKRDRRKSETRTTAGKLAKKTKTSTHKAKQAIALNKAVESGAVSADVQQAVMRGKKKLKDAVPAKAKPGKTNPQPATDPAAALRAEIVNAWEGVKKKIAVADHRELRKVLAGIIREEQKQFDK